MNGNKNNKKKGNNLLGKKMKDKIKEREEGEKKSLERKSKGKNKSLNDELLQLFVPTPQYKDVDPEQLDSMTKSWKPKKNKDSSMNDLQEEETKTSDSFNRAKKKSSLRTDDSLFHSKYAGKVVSKKSLKDFSDEEEEEENENSNQLSEEDEEDEYDEYDGFGDEMNEDEEDDEQNQNQNFDEEEDQFDFEDKKSNGNNRKKKAEKRIDRLFAGFGYSESEGENEDDDEFGEEEERKFGESFFKDDVEEEDEEGEGKEENEEDFEEEDEDQITSKSKKPIKSKVLDEADELQRQLEEGDEPSTFRAVKDEENELEKAFHTRNQTTLFGNVMGLRIHMQNSLYSANRFPKKEQYSQFQKNKEVKSKLEEVNKSLMKLMGDFLEIKSCLKEQNEETNQYKGVKRPPPSDLDSLWRSIQEEENSFKTFEEETIEKWNQRVLLSSGVNAGKQFKAINQTVMTQVNNILEDSNRLIARTQTKRTPFRSFGSETGDDKLEKDEEIFDDGDFYQYLLKDVVESGSKDLDPLVFSQFLKENSRLNRKSKKHSVPKSKGRQIQYETIEKLVGFMAPEPLPVNFLEQLERSQELFSNLFGQRPN